tara:strand:+ start:43 stop:489 length:447 start_codon:yes stop_codon:yes gene_type:complete
MAAKENHIEILRVEIEYDSKKWHLYLNDGLIKTASRSQDLVDHILFLRNLVYKEINILEIYNRNSRSTHRVNHWRLARLVLDAEERMQRDEKLFKQNSKIRDRVTESSYLQSYNKKLHRRQPIKPIRAEVKRHDPKILRPILRDEKTW